MTQKDYDDIRAAGFSRLPVRRFTPEDVLVRMALALAIGVLLTVTAFTIGGKGF